MQALIKPAGAHRVYRINAGETNKFVLLCDPQPDATGFVQVIEIFDVGGATPPNTHRAADELFYVLHGTGEAITAQGSAPIGPGSTILVRAGQEHAIRNTGATRLYCLTTMVPDEAFAALIKNGVPDALDAQDLRVLGW
jgi:mannose-6-phosphate isomerase-like protein (cupin superfamily)